MDRYPGCPRFAIAGADFGHASLHVGDLYYQPGHGVPHHYHTGGAEETQIMLEGELECWVDGKRVVVYPGRYGDCASGDGSCLSQSNWFGGADDYCFSGYTA